MKKIIALLLFISYLAGAAEAPLLQPAAELELVQDVDVVVVGGSSGAVAAALQARKAGASVFLVSQRPFLGEDMAATYRLRLSKDENTSCELLRSIFAVEAAVPDGLAFTYTTDKKAARLHQDKGGTMLCNASWVDAARDSVQFDEDVEITINPVRTAEIGSITIIAYRRDGDKGFATARFEVRAQDDSGRWHDVGSVQDYAMTGHNESVEYEIPVKRHCRQLKIKAVKEPDATRQLLGEIIVHSSEESRDKAPVRETTTPFKVKRALDKALLQAGVAYITGSSASEVLVDESGAPAGVVIANRNGRQCVKAKVIIDATERGVLARDAGVEATPFPAGTYTFKRVVIAGEAPRAEGMQVRELFGVFDAHISGIRNKSKDMPGKISGRMYECEMQINMRDASVRSFSEAEQKARDMTFVPTQLDEADQLFFVPPDHLRCVASYEGGWQGVDQLNVNCFKTRGAENLFVLGAMADISRDAAAELLKPGNLMAAGEMIGKAAAQTARQRGEINRLKSARQIAARAQSARVLETNKGLPPYLTNTGGKVKVAARELPVLATCDVVVAGAGTGGAPAGISAARHGMRTIVCEYIYKMGGVSTDGLIGRYYHGNRVGFTTEIDKGVEETGAVFVQAKSEWYRAENRKAGAEIWYGTLVTGTVVEDNRITGVVVMTPQGNRGVIRCAVAIDATGNAVLPAMAGCETEFISEDELALQGVGQTPKRLGASYTNTDIGFVDDTDAADMFFFALRTRLNMSAGIWDQAQIVNSRERRRLIGAFYMSPLDVANERTYPDVVVQTKSNFDSHGYTVHDQFFIEDPGHHSMMVNLPLRCMLPKKLDGLLVIGLGISAHRDAMPILRMQPDVQNQGYAAGIVAAEALKAGVAVRKVDIQTVQKQLIEKGVLPVEVLSMKDNFPLSEKAFKQAVEDIKDNYKGLKVLLTDYPRSIPLLRQAYHKCEGEEDKLKYAHTLALMGDGIGEDILIRKIESMEWDKGWNFRGMGQFNRSVSWVDSYIISLGRAKSVKALPAMFAKARALTAGSEFSHYRALALAFEQIGDKSAAPVLAAMLNIPTVKGYSFEMSPDMPLVKNYANREGDRERSLCLREIACARALYNLDDHQRVGEEVLRRYAKDPRGAYSKHVRMVLGEL